jgi:lipid-A-disaccharide synthase
MLQAAAPFAEEYQLVVAAAPGIDPSFYEAYTGDGYGVVVLFDQTYRILSQADAALVTSGTATLETALLNVPQVVCYRTAIPRAIYWAFKYILHTPYISLVNLVCGREVVKELFAKFFTVENIREELHRLLKELPYREKMLTHYAELQRIMGGPGASDRAADIIQRGKHFKKYKIIV